MEMKGLGCRTVGWMGGCGQGMEAWEPRLWALVGPTLQAGEGHPYHGAHMLPAWRRASPHHLLPCSCLLLTPHTRLC